MDAAPADSPFIAHLYVADLPGHFGKKRAGTLEKIGRLEFVVGGERADRDLPVSLANRVKIADAADINHNPRLRESELLPRDQPVAPGNPFRILSVLGS